MNMRQNVKITFFEVKDNAAKLRFICDQGKHCFIQSKRLLITLPTEEAAQYVDALLWCSPEESFIPHVLTAIRTQEAIAITTQTHQNLNDATCLLNLCSEVHPIYQEFNEVYELFDLTHPQKAELSHKRLHTYQNSNLAVQRLSFSA